LKAMKALYYSTFTPIYKFGKKLVVDKKGQLICIHFDYLHKAPIGKLVYRGIQAERLEGIMNKACVDVDFVFDKQFITILSLKLGLYGPENKIIY